MFANWYDQVVVLLFSLFLAFILIRDFLVDCVLSPSPRPVKFVLLKMVGTIVSLCLCALILHKWTHNLFQGWQK